MKIGNTNIESPDINTISNIKENKDSDLLFSFSISNSAISLSNLNANDVEKYELINNLLAGNPREEELVEAKDGPPFQISYRILKDITSNKIVLTRTIEGEERTIVLIKK